MFLVGISIFNLVTMSSYVIVISGVSVLLIELYQKFDLIIDIMYLYAISVHLGDGQPWMN